jgi:DNA-binding NtrC family response regulator
MVDFSVLALDDETDILDSLSNLLGSAGYRVSAFSRAREFLAEEGWKKGPGAALIDLSLDGESGIEVLEALKASRPEYPCAAISGTSEIRMAVRAIKAGAREFFEKPLEARPILNWLGSLREAADAEAERRQLLADTLARYELVGSSEAIKAARAKIAEYAPLSETVLVVGETGTGKELAAAQLHYLSPRRSRPFKAVNIAALSADLIDSQLFGHLKGAFSGASERNEGLIIASRKSTLFLDEIGELRLDIQAKLLRALQDREVLSIGSVNPEKVDLRFVCATNRDLAAEIAKGGFRQDLYYRIAGLTVEMPSLRERISDIPELARCFLGRFSREYNAPDRELDDSAIDKLSSYAFPGNVRELQSILLRASLNAGGHPADSIRADGIALTQAPLPVFSDDGIFTLPDNLANAKRKLEKRYIETQLIAHGYSVPAVAESLGLLPSNLYRRMRSLDIDPNARNA